MHHSVFWVDSAREGHCSVGKHIIRFTSMMMLDIPVEHVMFGSVSSEIHIRNDMTLCTLHTELT